MIPADQIANELINRGYTPLAVDLVGDELRVTFDVLPDKSPNWIKAVLVPASADPVAIDFAFQTWQHETLEKLSRGVASEIVRKMIAAHGSHAVIAALRPKTSLLGAVH